MSRLLVAVLGAMLIVMVGCKSDGDKDASKSDSAMKASADACAHCPDVQKATADGKCPICAAKAASSSSSAGDECPVCPGEQMASAEGKCPDCDAVVAKK